MSGFELFLTIIYFILAVIALISNVFGIPGNLIIFFLTLGYKLLTGPEVMGWLPVIVVFILFITGEILESALGLRGARKVGLSKKAMLASFIGAIAGSILMAPFLLGVGAVIGAALGAFLGAFIITILEERKLKKAVEGGIESAKGRVYGTLLKRLSGLVMIIVALIAAIR